jgi:hypothetical protein
VHSCAGMREAHRSAATSNAHTALRPALSPSADCAPAGSLVIGDCKCFAGSDLDATDKACECKVDQYSDGNSCKACPPGSSAAVGEQVLPHKQHCAASQNCCSAAARCAHELCCYPLARSPEECHGREVPGWLAPRPGVISPDVNPLLSSGLRCWRLMMQAAPVSPSASARAHSSLSLLVLAVPSASVKPTSMLSAVSARHAQQTAARLLVRDE